jgi:hypothetical protein
MYSGEEVRCALVFTGDEAFCVLPEPEVNQVSIFWLLA